MNLVDKDDLISREMALGALLGSMCGTGYQSRAMRVIRMLPTISPEETMSAMWISVKEEMPKNEVPVLIAAKRMGAYGKTYRFSMTAFHTDGKSFTIDSLYSWNDDCVEMEYDEEEESYIVPEGWWEDVRCGDEFNMIDSDIVVTHWMPLPLPPKEDEPC